MTKKLKTVLASRRCPVFVSSKHVCSGRREKYGTAKMESQAASSTKARKRPASAVIPLSSNKGQRRAPAESLKHPRNSSSSVVNVINELNHHGEASSESGVCNLEDDSEDSDADVFDHEDFQNLDFDLPDDESTIEEQEMYEAKTNNTDPNFESAELEILEADNGLT